MHIDIGTSKQFINLFCLYPLKNKLFVYTAKMSNVEGRKNLGTILKCESIEISEQSTVVCFEISDNQENFKTQLLKNCFPFFRSFLGFFVLECERSSILSKLLIFE